jgi:pentatricopeptide repeat protein
MLKTNAMETCSRSFGSSKPSVKPRVSVSKQIPKLDKVIAASTSPKLDNWQCANCGTESFSWRSVCLNCGSSKSPDLHATAANETVGDFQENMSLFRDHEHETLMAKNDLQDTASMKANPDDWTCPGCGTLCFSWRDNCFNCGVLKPGTVPKKALAPAPKKKGRGRPRKEELVVATPLKEQLEVSMKTKDFTDAVAEAESRLAAKGPIKASVIATVIRTFGKAGRFDRALDVFNSIGKKTVSARRRPSSYHYSAIMTACADNKKWETALEILDQVRDDKRSRPNVIIYTAAMTACSKAAQWKEVLEIFDTIVEERIPLDTACYNAAITACSHTNNFTKAFDIFEEMSNSRIQPDDLTYGAMLSCCDKAGDWVLAHSLITRVKETRKLKLNKVMVTSAMSAYNRGGEPKRALDLFEEVKKPSGTNEKFLLDYPIYSAAMFSLCALAEGESTTSKGRPPTLSNGELRQGVRSLEALKLLREMAKRNIRVTANVVLVAMRAMEAEGMHSAAQEVLELAVRSNMFPGLELMSDKNRKVDVRKWWPSACRALLRIELTRIYKGESSSDDVLIIVGDDENKRKFVMEVLQSNIFPDNSNPIENAFGYGDGAMVKISKASLEKWIQRGGGGAAAS